VPLSKLVFSVSASTTYLLRIAIDLAMYNQ
jgi:hypothetical protein